MLADPPPLSETVRPGGVWLPPVAERVGVAVWPAGVEVWLGVDVRLVVVERVFVVVRPAGVVLCVVVVVCVLVVWLVDGVE